MRKATLFQLGSDWQNAQILNAKAPTLRHTQAEASWPTHDGLSGNSISVENKSGARTNPECNATNIVTGPWAADEAGQSQSNVNLDHSIVRDGKIYMGTHLIVDLWNASRLDDLKLMEETLRECVRQSGATMLHIHLHHFTPNDGISGVAVLAESHITVHTWPERGYAAFDVMMCGDAEPHKCIEVLQQAFQPGETKVTEILRGEMAD